MSSKTIHNDLFRDIIVILLCHLIEMGDILGEYDANLQGNIGWELNVNFMPQQPTYSPGVMETTSLIGGWSDYR